MSHAASCSRRAFLPGLILLGFLATVTRAAEVITTPYPGITHIVSTVTTPRNLVIHIIKVELATPGLSFKVTPQTVTGTRETTRQSTTDFLNEQHAVVAINANFFVPFPSSDSTANVVGLAASEGHIYSPFEPQPVPGETTFPQQNYAIVPYAPALNIDAQNRANIVHLDPSNPDHKHILESTTLYNTISGSAQIITNGVKTIPTYTSPTATSPPPPPPTTAPAGLLVSNANFSGTNSWYDVLKARTAIGLTKDQNTLILCTIDQTGPSLGATGTELAEILLSYQVYNALNLDGGGSTSLALRDPTTHIGALANVSSDTTVTGGRRVGNNLGILITPAKVTTTRAATEPTLPPD